MSSSANFIVSKRGMIILKDSIDIETTLEALFDWFMRLDENFVKWDNVHHADFKLLSGETEVGDKIYFEEIVNGVRYAIKGKIIDKIKLDEKFVLSFKTSSRLGTHLFYWRKSQ